MIDTGSHRPSKGHDTSEPRRRSMRGSESVAPAPVLQTQLTCFAISGVTGAQYLRLVPHLKIPHSRIGKLVFTDPAIFRGAILAAGEPPGSESADNADATALDVDHVDDCDDVESLAARLGFRRVLRRSA